MARNQYEKPGDVEFESLNAVKGGSAFNMLGVVDTISLYEDIEKMFMTGSLTFTDANNILRFYDFRDDVYIVGSFRTPLPTTAGIDLRTPLSEQTGACRHCRADRTGCRLRICAPNLAGPCHASPAPGHPLPWRSP